MRKRDGGRTRDRFGRRRREFRIRAVVFETMKRSGRDRKTFGQSSWLLQSGLKGRRRTRRRERKVDVSVELFSH